MGNFCFIVQIVRWNVLHNPQSERHNWGHLFQFIPFLIKLAPPLFFHFIDDYIGAASRSHLELAKCINYASNSHPSLTLKLSISNTRLSLIDLFVSMSGDKLTTHIHYIPNYCQNSTLLNKLSVSSSHWVNLYLSSPLRN